MSLDLFISLPAAADAVTDWNASAGKAALAACIAPGDDPLHESRLYAMMRAAGASRDAAVAEAARDFLVPVISQIPFPPACLQAGIASVEADYTAALAAVPNGNGQNSPKCIAAASKSRSFVQTSASPTEASTYRRSNFGAKQVKAIHLIDDSGAQFGRLGNSRIRTSGHRATHKGITAIENNLKPIPINRLPCPLHPRNLT